MKVVVTVFCGAVVVAGLAFLALRSEVRTIDRAETEQRVAAIVEAETGLSDPDVVCPVDLPRVEGHEVTCRTEGDGGVLRVRVRQVDRQANLEVTLMDAVLDRETVARDAEKLLARRFDQPFEVDCGPSGPVVLPAAGTISCTVISGDDIGSLQVSTDQSGNLAYEVTS